MSQKIGIWGLGIVGKSAIRYFSNKKVTVEVLDKRQPTAQEQEFLDAHNATFYGNEDLPSFLERNEYILPSCGIDLRPYSAYNHKWLSELDLFAKECTKPIIAITGSVGKTTVTHLLSHLLIANNKKIFTGGNIGVGLLESIDEANNADVIVLEVSSFQLERCKEFAATLAICTNIYANHLDRHGSLQAYINAKLNIISLQKNGSRALLPLSLFHSIPEEIRASRSLNFFTTQAPTAYDFELMSDFHKLYFLHNATLFMNYQTINSKIYDFVELPFISYTENVTILAATLHMLGCSLEKFVATINAQELPEHRLEKIATIKGVDFYNDSKATIPASTLAAIEKIHGKPIVLFLGGVSKGVDRSDFIRQLKDKVRLVYCFGKEAEQLKLFCDSNNIPAIASTTLDEAFIALPPKIQPQDQILFSPAGASFDLFSNYQERGNHFKKLVIDLKNKSA
jgi:UDP-N-acetylmuramoylalanine--D-glutamate ligase